MLIWSHHWHHSYRSQQIKTTIRKVILPIRSICYARHNYISRKEFCYINTSEIPSELSLENLISSHGKITCYRHTWRDHHCYGYIINRVFVVHNRLFSKSRILRAIILDFKCVACTFTPYSDNLSKQLYLKQEQQQKQSKITGILLTSYVYNSIAHGGCPEEVLLTADKKQHKKAVHRNFYTFARVSHKCICLM